MGLIVVTLLGIIGVLGAVCSKLLADECKAWFPTIVAKLIGMAVKKLPIEKRERFFEEWHGHVHEIPGDLGKIVAACGFLIAAWDIAEGPFGLRKRALDLAVAGLLLLLLAPLFSLVTFLVAVTSPGPVFVRQTRIGRDGKAFGALNFRTMHVDADDRLRAYLISNHDAIREWETTGRLRFDPRVTTLGVILRKSSFDLFPLLLNILTGDMSVVGPQATAAQSEKLNWSIACKPGITGPWLFGRHFQDGSYTRNWSIMLDLKIVLASLPALLTVDENGEHNSESDLEADWKIGLLVIILLLAFTGMLVSA
ncbi:sugar transferase [Bradyrhizobium canariense]|uniref:Sugar transferase involved in LPS biosynthesis (Colanic, teichoic acid) n=1 Tax=Bradyrhizobium canariense TaxID=255045 RepID=A0A1H1TD18_9BRAD|nr:sugar transferase [Bradyrhizobium canariense]SDS58024.1 Sugar transferase involved in LPS biosynthesis (colanic, teichoic acid) [Bradyrhizobium canariense]